MVETGGFSAAARKLNMSTTMVSNHVQALEDRLGVRLLQRTTRRVNLTEIGKAYYDRCVQILAAHRGRLRRCPAHDAAAGFEPDRG
ncbi:DNA-binding transcriptional LysR family regulator [Bradyrhizobium diazoefficiens]